MPNNSILQKPLVSAARKLKPGENIKYLLLIKIPDSDDTFWEIIKGRELAYDYIKNNIDQIEVDQSFIIANGMKNIDFDNMHTIYNFVKFVKQENNIVDDFDIEDYTSGDNNININNPSDIGIGLESAGKTFTGIAGTFDSNENE